MADDISDILDDVLSRSTTGGGDPFAAYDERYGGGHSDRGGGGVSAGQVDLQALTRAWVNERGTVELLPWPKDNLINRVAAQIRSQIATIEELTGATDPRTNFGLVIIQTEVERWKFLLRSYLRCRTAKIDRHALFYLSDPNANSNPNNNNSQGNGNGDGEGRMSETETAYATRHQALLRDHYMSSFLGDFPAQLRGLDDCSGGVNMVSGPDAEGAVFVRGVGGRGGESVIVTGRGRDGDGEVEVRRGEVVVVRWADVRGLVERGEMELV